MLISLDTSLIITGLRYESLSSFLCCQMSFLLIEDDCFFFLQVSGLMKNLPSVAALTAERDGEIRKAALNTLATAYKNLGMSPTFFFYIISQYFFLLPFRYGPCQTGSCLQILVM